MAQFTINDYLTIEIGKGENENDFDELIKGLLPQKEIEEFNSKIEHLYYIWSDNFSSLENKVKVEEDTYNYIYSNKALNHFLHSFKRVEEESVLNYVMATIGKRGGSLLDLGCGDGIKTVYYSLNPSLNITAVDKLGSALEIAKERAIKYGSTNIEFLNMDFISSKFKGTYDLIIATNVLHECGDNLDIPYYSDTMESKIDNISKHLSNNGLFICTFQVNDSCTMTPMVKSLLEKRGIKNIVLSDIMQDDKRHIEGLYCIKP